MVARGPNRVMSQGIGSKCLTGWVLNIVVLAGCAGWTLAGCEHFRPEPVDPVIPRLKVNLPESPPLELPNAPVRDESGVYTVNGLLKESAALMNTVVIVKGVILDRHVCEQEPTALQIGRAHV